MTQSQMERELSRYTGESLSTIRHRGFSLANEHEADLEPIALPAMIDWDQHDAVQRPRRFHRRQRLAA